MPPGHFTYRKTFNKCLRRLLELWLQNPRRLLETGVYSRPSVYKNTDFKLPVFIACYDKGTYRILMFILLLASTKIDNRVKLAHLVVGRMF